MIKLDDAAIIKACTESTSMTEVCEKLNVSHTWLKDRATKLNCWIPNKGGKGTIKFPNGNLARKKFSLEDWNEGKSIPISRCALKKWIIRENLLPYTCANGCGDKHLGKPLSLHLDHINGKNNDHRLNNLRFLCPNCHSQTTTYAGKNK